MDLSEFGSTVTSCVTLCKLLNHSELLHCYQWNGEYHFAKVTNIFSLNNSTKHLGHIIPFLPLSLLFSLSSDHSFSISFTQQIFMDQWTRCCQCFVHIPLDPFTRLSVCFYSQELASVSICQRAVFRLLGHTLLKNEKGLRVYIPLWAFINQ